MAVASMQQDNRHEWAADVDAIFNFCTQFLRNWYSYCFDRRENDRRLVSRRVSGRQCQVHSLRLYARGLKEPVYHAGRCCAELSVCGEDARVSMASNPQPPPRTGDDVERACGFAIRADYRGKIYWRTAFSSRRVEPRRKHKYRSNIVAQWAPINNSWGDYARSSIVRLFFETSVLSAKQNFNALTLFFSVKIVGELG